MAHSLPARRKASRIIGKDVAVPPPVSPDCYTWLLGHTQSFGVFVGRLLTHNVVSNGTCLTRQSENTVGTVDLDT